MIRPVRESFCSGARSMDFRRSNMGGPVWSRIAGWTKERAARRAHNNASSHVDGGHASPRYASRSFAHPARYALHSDPEQAPDVPVVAAGDDVGPVLLGELTCGHGGMRFDIDRKSTRLNSSHVAL